MKKSIILLCGMAIKKLRVERGLKLEYLAIVLKVDKTKLSRIENSLQEPDAEMLFKLCIFYDITVSGFWRIIEMEIVKKYPPPTYSKQAA